jgi:hypothetical protein
MPRGGNRFMVSVEATQYGNTVIGALTNTLRACRENITYDELMGLSGAAFRLRFAQTDWCPENPFSADLLQDVCRAVGRTVLVEPHAADRKAVQRHRAAIVDSLNHGRPVLFLYLEAGTIVGYQDNGASFFYRPWGFKGDNWLVLKDEQWDWAGCAILSEKSAAPPRHDSIVRSLKSAVDLSRAPHSAGSGNVQFFAYGMEAWQLWIKQLVEPDRFDQRDLEKYKATQAGNSWTLECLIDARASAARYLRMIRSEYSPAAADHLSRAADMYDQVASALKLALPLAPNPWSQPKAPWTDDMRRRQSAMLKATMAVEHQALAEIAGAIAP